MVRPAQTSAENEEGTQRAVFKLWMYCLLAYLPSVAPSGSLGFSSVLVPPLKALNVSAEGFSWIASAAPIATPFGCVTAGIITDKFGRIGAFHLINVISVLGWSVIAVSYYMANFTVLYVVLLVGRIITGFSTGLCAVSPIYMAEVSTVGLRPLFTTISTAAYSFGILVVYCQGYVLKNDWGLLAITMVTVPAVSIVLTALFLPETPMWLVTKKRYERAKANIVRIYGKRGEQLALADLDALVEKEERRQALEREGTPLKPHQRLKQRAVYCPFLIMSTFFFIQQFSGVMVVVFYAINIAEKAGVKLDFYFAIILIGICRVVTSAFISLVSGKTGRRLSSFISGVGVTVSLYGLSAYLICHDTVMDDQLQSSLSWLPLTLVLLFIILSTYGFLTIPFAMVAEVFPMEVRGFMVGLTICVCYICCFVAIKTYPMFEELLPNYVIFFCYGSVGFAGTIFLIIFLPETRGKTFTEIEEGFAKDLHRHSHAI